MANKVNLAAKLDAFDDHWSPKIVGRYNDNDIMVVKVLKLIKLQSQVIQLVTHTKIQQVLQ